MIPSFLERRNLASPEQMRSSGSKWGVLLGLACASVLAPYGMAGEIDRWELALRSTPTYQAALSSLELARLAVAREAANYSPRASVYTTGYLARDDSASAPRRADVGVDPYIDGVVELGMPIFDLGQIGYRVSATEHDLLAAESEFSIARDESLEQLLSLAIALDSLLDQVGLLDKQYREFAALLELAESRYRGGLETIDVVRDAQIELGQIDSERMVLAGRLADMRARSLALFGLERADELPQFTAFLDFLAANEPNLHPEASVTKARFQSQIRATESSLRAVASESLPAFQLSISTRIFDVDEGSLDKLSTFGGITASMNLFDQTREVRKAELVAQIKNLDRARDSFKQQFEADISRVKSGIETSRLRLAEVESQSRLVYEQLDFFRLKEQVSVSDLPGRMSLLARSHKLSRDLVSARESLRNSVVKMYALVENLHGSLEKFMARTQVK